MNPGTEKAFTSVEQKVEFVRAHLDTGAIENLFALHNAMKKNGAPWAN